MTREQKLEVVEKLLCRNSEDSDTFFGILDDKTVQGLAAIARDLRKNSTRRR